MREVIEGCGGFCGFESGSMIYKTIGSPMEAEMRHVRVPYLWSLVWVGLTFWACFSTPSVAWADDPMLAIRLTDGESAVYSVSEISWIGFEDEATLVVVSASASNNYAADEIVRIEFLWDFSGVQDPKDEAALIHAIHLFQNQPNPFSPETQIRFELPQAGQAELTIYAPDGRWVRTLAAGKCAAGPHTIRWDGLDDAGRRAPGGVYFYSLIAPGIKESRQMILLP